MYKYLLVYVDSFGNYNTELFTTYKAARKALRKYNPEEHAVIYKLEPK